MTSADAHAHLCQVRPQHRCFQTVVSVKMHKCKDAYEEQLIGAYGCILFSLISRVCDVPENGCGSFPGVSRG